MAKSLCAGFRIDAVISGMRFGMLIGKETGRSHGVTWAYFYSLDSNGLPPSEEVIRLCRDQLYPLRPSNDEKVVLSLLKNCAEYCAQEVYAPVAIPESKVWCGKGEYSRIVQRLFDATRQSDLAVFIGSYGKYKANILDRDYKTGELIVRAREFLTLRPDEIMPKEPKYIIHARQLLRIGQRDLSPVWFRRAGPLGVDFDNGTVLVCKERLDELTNTVLSNPFSLLCGPPASGKTVLVRHLAHVLCQDNPRVYYFRYRDFDIDELAHVINCTRGCPIRS